MASWKKVIVSGSVAELNNLFVTNSITASAYSGDGSALTGVAATSLNIDAFGTDHTSITIADTDKLAISDGGTEGRINASQIATYVFNKASDSGDATIGADGGITINANSVALGTDTTGDYVATVADGGSGAGISIGGATGEGQAATVTLDLSDLAAAAVDVSADSLAIIDANDSNGSKKESIADFVAGIAGSGLNASEGQLSISETGDISAVTAGAGLSGGGSSGALSLAVDISEFSAVTPANGDSFLTLDSDGSTEQLTTTTALATLFAGTGLTATNSVIAVDTLNQDTTGNAATATALETARNFTTTGDVVVASTSFDGTGNFSAAATIQANAVEGSMLNNNVISGLDDIGAAIASGDELLISDGGTIKRTDVDRLATFFAGAGLAESEGVMSVGAGTGIDVAANAISVDVSDFMTNGSNNRIVTATGTDAMNAEANLTFDGSTLSVTGDATISGNLDVNGTLTTIQTTNLAIKDQFITIASGSQSAADGGIIVSKQADGAGFALGYDTATTRWAFDNDLAVDATGLTPDSYVGTVTFSNSAASGNPTYGGSSNGYGAIHVETDTGDIFIYS